MNINQTLKIFTPKEFIVLDKNELSKMLENKISFTVSDILRLENDLYYCYGTESIHNQNGEKIELTKLEKRFVNLLIQKENQIVDYETIKNIVWKGKDMSIYTMRNIINKIRDKTYYGFIKNISNHGYVIPGKD